jgi:hypothetical protein
MWWRRGARLLTGRVGAQHGPPLVLRYLLDVAALLVARCDACAASQSRRTSTGYKINCRLPDPTRTHGM